MESCRHSAAEIGEIKQVGEHLGQIDMMDGYKLKARIDERYISRVFVGQEAEFDFNRETYKLRYQQDLHRCHRMVLLRLSSSSKVIHRRYKRGQTVQLRMIFSSASRCHHCKAWWILPGNRRQLDLCC